MSTVNTFSIRDLRERTGELVRTAEAGNLSVVAKHGAPVFLAVPFTKLLLDSGVNVSLAVKLYDDNTITLPQAAKLAGMGLESFMDLLGRMGVAVIRYAPEDLENEVEGFLN